MALRRKREPDILDINFKVAEVAVQGKLLTYDVANPGFAQVQASISGVVTTRVAGVLMTTVVDKDFGAQPVNFQVTETGLSGHVQLLKKGEMGIDQIVAGSVFGPGSGVWLRDNGNVANTAISDGGSSNAVGNQQVGIALSRFPVLNASGVSIEPFVDVRFEV